MEFGWFEPPVVVVVVVVVRASGCSLTPFILQNSQFGIQLYYCYCWKATIPFSPLPLSPPLLSSLPSVHTFPPTYLPSYSTAYTRKKTHKTAPFFPLLLYMDL